MKGGGISRVGFYLEIILLGVLSVYAVASAIWSLIRRLF